MSRKLARLSLVLALVGLIAGPAEAAKKRRPPAPVTYFMNWDGGCDGGGYLSSTAVPNGAACAQYIPAYEPTHVFRATGQDAFVLDAAKPVSVDFAVDHIVTGAVEFQVVVEATIDGGDTKVIASGTQAVTVETGLEPTAFHYELEPDPSLHLAKVSYVTVAVTVAGGATWSSLDMESGNASVAFNGGEPA